MGTAASELAPLFVECPATTKEGGDFVSQSKGLAWGFSSMQGWRPQQEDAHICLPYLCSMGSGWSDTSLFAVFDGHGGEPVARFCERHLPNEVARRPANDARTALAAAFHHMDEMLATPWGAQELRGLTRTKAPTELDAGTVGCTAAVCLVRPRAILVANAGDSRVVLCRAGKAVPLSHDHKPNDPRERCRIQRAGGRVVPQWVNRRTVIHRLDGQLSVSRGIGDLKLKRDPRLAPQEQRLSAEPDVCEVERTPQDEFLVVACDGVWDVMDSQQVVDYIRCHLDSMLRGLTAPSAVIGGLLDQCLAETPNPEGGKGTDNMTMVLVIFARARPADRGAPLPTVLAGPAGLGAAAPDLAPRGEKGRAALKGRPALPTFVQCGMPIP